MTTRFAAAEGVPTSRVVGSGATLDTARFGLCSGATWAWTPNVHAYVVGSTAIQVLTWSLVRVSGVTLEGSSRTGHPLDQVMPTDDPRAQRRLPHHEGKATYYGIGQPWLA